MPTAVYRNGTQQRVPSCTGILADDVGGLIHWAWQCGVDGLDYRKMRDEAAKAGEVGHILVEAAVKQKIPVFPTDGARHLGEKCYKAFLDWQKQSKIRWTDSELSLVSENHQFGGTIDLIGTVPGSNSYVLGDVKTGKLYPKYLMQIAAYGELFRECTGYPVKTYHLLRFDRETGDFAHYQFDDLEDAWQGFQLRLKLYHLMAKLKKRV